MGSLSFQEAIELEQRAHAADLERRRKQEEKRQRTGMPLKGEVLTRQERESRIWAFMSVSKYSVLSRTAFDLDLGMPNPAILI